jgi:aspartyl-tRNA(Asn)/glutamyl-tRNA(Gln) amidotransferase subunit A
MKLNELTIKLASEKLKNKEISSVELTDACFSEIENKDKDINAFISTLKDEAMQMAKDSDVRRAKNEILSVIDGVPIAVKDNMCMTGTKTTAASKILENFVAPYDATVISKLKNAGAVIIGKTNLDEFAMGSSTENSYFGVTKNPADLSRVAGGSSGGSAAAVASDMCIAALGSDTGGSIRQPASFCGVVGFKPTYGTVSRYGLLAMASSLDQIGPFTKTAEDAEILFDIIRGYDERDSTSLNPKSELQMSNQIRNSKFEIQNLRIGVPKEYFAEGLDPEVKKVIEAKIAELKEMGAQIKEISLTNSKYALACYYVLMPVEVASNLGRYDGIKYGFSARGENLLDVYKNSRSEGFGAEVKRRIILGTYTSSSGYIDQYYNKAQKVRTLIAKDFEDAFSEVDFILGPVVPTTAFKIGEKSKDPLSMYLSDIYTIAVNLAGLPAASVPVGKVDGLPVGLHIIGPQLSDLNLLNLAKICESQKGDEDGIQGA